MSEHVYGCFLSVLLLSGGVVVTPASVVWEFCSPVATPGWSCTPLLEGDLFKKKVVYLVFLGSHGL